MTTSRPSLPPQDFDRIAAYLDNSMSAPTLAAFEAEVAQRPELASELEAHRAVDVSLNRLFAEDATAAGGQASGVPAASGIPNPIGRVSFQRWAAVAAALLLAAAAAVYFLRPDPLLIRPETVWTNVQRADFKPSWKCVDDAEFRAYLKSRLGESFTIAQSPGLEVIGWAYGSDYTKYPLSKDTLILINKIGDDHSVVMIDRVGHERRLRVDPASGLHLFTRHVGGLVLYELTPRDEAVVLPAVVQNS